jgi:two-component system nitrogen regulation response regulator GlnG
MRPDLPIVVMSAQNTILTAITAAERGAFEYLPKPFDLKELTGGAARAGQPAAKRERRRARAAKTGCRSSAARPRCRKSTASSRG